MNDGPRASSIAHLGVVELILLYQMVSFWTALGNALLIADVVSGCQPLPWGDNPAQVLFFEPGQVGEWFGRN